MAGALGNMAVEQQVYHALINNLQDEDESNALVDKLEKEIRAAMNKELQSTASYSAEISYEVFEGAVNGAVSTVKVVGEGATAITGEFTKQILNMVIGLVREIKYKFVSYDGLFALALIALVCGSSYIIINTTGQVVVSFAKKVGDTAIEMGQNATTAMVEGFKQVRGTDNLTVLRNRLINLENRLMDAAARGNNDREIATIQKTIDSVKAQIQQAEQAHTRTSPPLPAIGERVNEDSHISSSSNSSSNEGSNALVVSGNNDPITGEPPLERRRRNALGGNKKKKTRKNKKKNNKSKKNKRSKKSKRSRNRKHKRSKKSNK